MDTNWATENLQAIRILMERTALYRRALTPIMFLNGALGLLGAIIGWVLEIDTAKGFVIYWMVVASLAVTGSFLLVRRQSLKDSEPFWTPPTRRITAAIVPALFFGAVLALYFACLRDAAYSRVWLPPLWMAFYGVALHAAGFFTPRGLRLLGWLFVLAGGVDFILLGWFVNSFAVIHDAIGSGHVPMGVSFGGLHIMAGIYLYYTEKGKNAA